MFHGSRWLRNLPLTRKLTTIGVVVASAAVLLAGTVLLTFDLAAEVQEQVSESETIADIVGLNATAALTLSVFM